METLRSRVAHTNLTEQERQDRNTRFQAKLREITDRFNELDAFRQRIGLGPIIIPRQLPYDCGGKLSAKVKQAIKYGDPFQRRSAEKHRHTCRSCDWYCG